MKKPNAHLLFYIQVICDNKDKQLRPLLSAFSGLNPLGKGIVSKLAQRLKISPETLAALIEISGGRIDG